MSFLPRLNAPGAFALGTLVAVIALIAFQPFSKNTARAQEPSPTPTRTPVGVASPSATPQATPSGTPSPLTCTGTLQGGQTIPAVSGARVTLPASGTYGLIITPPGQGEPSFTVCHVESMARVTIDALTCREMSESVPNASGALLIAQIVESCTTGGAVAGATAVATQQPGSAIQPPNTGGGGLKTDD